MSKGSRKLVEMRGIVKVYPDGVKALDKVDFDLAEGEVHALLGENGAGKTTLMRILYGEIRPTSGMIIVRGKEARWRGPWDAIKAGIAMVYQNFRLVDALTVRENLLIYLSSLGVSRSEAESRIMSVAEDLGLSIPMEARVEDLPMGVRQRVEIVKALSGGARVLILDEPTSNLTPLEAEGLFRLIEKLKKRGVGIVYITHKLREVMSIADRVTVLRKGRVVGRSVRGDRFFSEEKLASLMVGEVLAPQRSLGEPGKDEVLRVESLTVESGEGVIRVRDVSFKVVAGEIVGVAGVAGNGQEELVEAIIGVRKPSKGSVYVNGVRVRSARDFYRAGGGFIPGDRVRALAHELSVADNAAFIYYTGSRAILMTPSRVKQLFHRLVREFGLKAMSPSTPVGRLSGGNQQKVLVGSEFLRGFRVLVAVNPTQGLDVATTAFVRDLIVKASREGVGVLLVSTDLDEVLELSHRILVMSGGRVVGELRRGEASPERVGVLMGGS
ncbi:MAG: ABC transporter ATP-binding protein [Desulfurococcales archaeon]|nr:ABC transporter ATP-binding protein [Desulfurococcales archaeon]